jgi:pimeloyl-ACP methyl ester carboxylesterase
MKTLTLSGWGQPHDALASIAPDATHFDYSHFQAPEDALKAIAQAAESHNYFIGWSLGGQLLVRAVAAGLIHPKKLVLIGAPFQFVKSENFPLGMPIDQFAKFRANYANNPLRTIHKSWELVAMGDKNLDEVKKHLAAFDKEAMLAKNWLHWLDNLNGFSCDTLDFSGFPPTLLLHGAQDKVVAHEQSHEFAKRIAKATNILLPDAGHAPHWHDKEIIKKHIRDHFSV